LSEHYSPLRLRRALIVSTVGRILAVVLSLSVIFTIARNLSASDYGAYAAFLSLLSLSVMFSLLGLDWAAARFIPEYRDNATDRQLRGFVASLISIRLAALVVAAGLLWLLAWPIAGLFSLSPWTALFPILALLLIFEGLVLYIRHALLEPLLLQGAVLVNVASRQLMFLGLLVFALLTGDFDIKTVVTFEASAAAFALAIALVQILLALRSNGSGPPSDKAWSPPSRAQILRISLHNYGGSAISTLGNMHAITLLGTMVLGTAAMAPFGFFRQLTEQVGRYLPAQFFISIIRPRLIVDYTKTRDFAALNRDIQILYKSSLFALAPVIAVVAVGGEALFDLLSAGRYGQDWMLALCFAIMLIPFSHGVIAAMTVNIVNESRLNIVGAALALVVLPLGPLLAYLGLGAYGLVFALTLQFIIFNGYILFGLRRNGFQFRYDLAWFLRLYAPLFLTIGILQPTLTHLSDIWSVALTLVLAPLVYLGLSLLTRPYSRLEGIRLRRFFGLTVRAEET
jgi:O-antigen/teichoic acid export membrane protein